MSAATARIAIQLASPVQDRLAGFVAENRRYCTAVVQEGMFAGKSCAICGAGPSLTAHAIEGADLILACNSALPLLLARGGRVDYGVGIDQSPGLLREWWSAPDVPYLVASSCDPALIAHLAAQGRRLLFFHNAVGIPDELAAYRKWPTTYMVCAGATVVSRLLWLARWMGFERMDVYGADCAFGPADVAHANGESARAAFGAPFIMEGVIAGRTWRTRPDMLMSAVDLARTVRDAGGRVRLIGDTLPVALLGKDDAFLDQVSRRLAPGELPPKE